MLPISIWEKALHLKNWINYLITPAKNPADQLDIFDARQLIQPHYKKEEFLILGIAAGYEEALQLIEQITGECLDARGDCNLREYLLC